jgi:DeoR/GlpR family transcriptional regulator of sugar metabolism
MITFRSRFCNIVLVIPAQRRKRILDALRADGAVSIRALAGSLETSAVTIRRDLDYLDSVGQLVIGPGTTTQVLARSLAARSGLTVVTNSLLVAEAFVDAPGNEVILTGGTLRASIRALVGEATNHTLRGLRADITFLSGNGLDAVFGLSTPNMTVADSDRSLAAAGHRVVALVDHTKFGIRTAIQTLAPSAISDLVTDESSPAGELAELVAAGVHVHVAQTGAGLSDTF